MGIQKSLERGHALVQMIVFRIRGRNLAVYSPCSICNLLDKVGRYSIQRDYSLAAFRNMLGQMNTKSARVLRQNLPVERE